MGIPLVIINHKLKQYIKTSGAGTCADEFAILMPLYNKLIITNTWNSDDLEIGNIAAGELQYEYYTYECLLDTSNTAMYLGPRLSLRDH